MVKAGADGPVRSIAELSLADEHRRGHRSGYAANVTARQIRGLVGRPGIGDRETRTFR